MAHETLNTVPNARPPPVDLDALISTISRSTGAEEQEVRNLYSREFAALLSAARVKTFVSLIAARRVKHWLVTQRQNRPAQSTAETGAGVPGERTGDQVLALQ